MTTYVYRFLNSEKETIYVGKTKNKIKQRLNTHFRNGHINRIKLSEVESIQYVEFKTKLEMDIAELYLINLWEPKINKISKHGEVINVHPFNVNELEWIDITKNEMMRIKRERENEYEKTTDEDEIELLKEMLNDCYEGKMFEYRNFYSEHDYAESILKDGFFFKPQELNADKILWVLNLLDRHSKGETSINKNINGEKI